MLDSHAKLAEKLAKLEAKYDGQFRVVFEALNELMAPPEPKRKPISFSVKERRASYRRRSSPSVGKSAPAKKCPITDVKVHRYE